MTIPGNKFDLAVFPLLDAVLFPGTTLPLQIFEERFWRMLEEVRAREWPLAVSLVTAARGDELKLSTICGAGEIQEARRHPGGGAEVLLYGTQRVKLLSVVQQRPYLIMEAQSLQIEEERTPLSKKGFEEYLGLIKTWAFLNPAVPDELTLHFDSFKEFGELTDFFVFHFIEDARAKQEYLNCTHPIQRAEMLANRLELEISRLNRKLKRQKKGLLLH